MFAFLVGVALLKKDQLLKEEFASKEVNSLF